MTRPLALAEMPQINHRICQASRRSIAMNDIDLGFDYDKYLGRDVPLARLYG
jgi:hypothetical protein